MHYRAPRSQQVHCRVRARTVRSRSAASDMASDTRDRTFPPTQVRASSVSRHEARVTNQPRASRTPAQQSHGRVRARNGSRRTFLFTCYSFRSTQQRTSYPPHSPAQTDKPHGRRQSNQPSHVLSKAPQPQSHPLSASQPPSRV